jgi:hypothetical protein
MTTAAIITVQRKRLASDLVPRGPFWTPIGGPIPQHRVIAGGCSPTVWNGR